MLIGLNIEKAEFSYIYQMIYGYARASTAGFKALPGGILASSYGVLQIAGFFDIGEHGYWWSTTEDAETAAINSRMSYDSGMAGFGFAGLLSSSKSNKMSVRCVKDN